MSDITLQVVKRRLPLLGVAAAVVALGLAARYGLWGPWAKYGGVALWATEAYVMVLLVRPTLAVRDAAIWALAVSWGVELFQLTGAPAWLSSHHILLRLIFGTTFHGLDLPAYAAGVALGAAGHWLWRARFGS